MLEKVVTLSRRYCDVILQMKKRAVIVLLYTTLLTGCSITSPETVFESHEGQFLTYNSFSTEYISGLNTSDYNPENFYPIPEGCFLSKRLLRILATPKPTILLGTIGGYSTPIMTVVTHLSLAISENGILPQIFLKNMCKVV